MTRRTARFTLEARKVPSENPVETPAEIRAGASSIATAAPRRGRALHEWLASWLLRAGLAFVLSYAATASLMHPETFSRYFPSFVSASLVSRLLPVFAVFEVLLAIGLMTYRYAYAASILTGFTMVAIIAVNPHAFDVLFRNVGIACGAFALAAQSRGEHDDRTSS